jgi:hypothetical protein
MAPERPTLPPTPSPPPAPAPAVQPPVLAEPAAPPAYAWSDPDHVLERLRALSQGPEPARSAPAVVATNWLAWLHERRTYLDGLNEADRLRRIDLWWERIDFHVWSDVRSVEDLAASRLAPLFSPADHAEFVRLLISEQRQWRAWLANLGIERIESQFGDSFRPGILEPKGGAFVPTELENLSMTAGPVQPGDGGYRLAGVPKRPARAPRLRYTLGPEV